MFERFFNSIKNIAKIEELRQRIAFTAMMLFVYRMGAHIPTPGINGEQLSEFLKGKGGALMGFLDMFSGGGLSRLTIFALGIMPYISASIIIQLLTVVIPSLQKLSKEGEMPPSGSGSYKPSVLPSVSKGCRAGPLFSGRAGLSV